MFSFAYGYPVTGAPDEEDADCARVFRFKVSASEAEFRLLRSELPPAGSLC